MYWIPKIKITAIWSLGHLPGRWNTMGKSCWTEIWNAVLYFIGEYPNLWDIEGNEDKLPFSFYGSFANVVLHSPGFYCNCWNISQYFKILFQHCILFSAILKVHFWGANNIKEKYHSAQLLSDLIALYRPIVWSASTISF